MISFSHLTTNGLSLNIPVGKVVCVGRNYAEHAKELGNAVPSQPLLFLKPASALIDLLKPIELPTGQGSCHHELEVAVLVSKPLKNVSEVETLAGISHITLALDLTLRDLQNQLKQKGHPWERAKAFDDSCPIAPWVEISQIKDLTEINFTLHRNDQLQQTGNSQDMIMSISQLISHISETFTLQPGDIILTGTPAGVGPVESGDQLKMTLQNSFSFLAAFK
ncbi:fumarylacetoacetate hydrolase family protein [Pelagibaculum spongiae]|uniref:Fumarylacetoacetate hydrolase family protein n=1 Tax=Pelagibaculum spongiae TaxID=2080658 RepID=A0A2V1H4V9_9GAMM|nr:fumarylacetoacetate hydrolase family protein [Pelagibaculum spongiae]PVZ70676.1 fumarylacetoacetate hydrolase family protein [Pelagibaculum spongiae]